MPSLEHGETQSQKKIKTGSYSHHTSNLNSHMHLVTAIRCCTVRCRMFPSLPKVLLDSAGLDPGTHTTVVNPRLALVSDYH